MSNTDIVCNFDTCFVLENSLWIRQYLQFFLYIMSSQSLMRYYFSHDKATQVIG